MKDQFNTVSRYYVMNMLSNLNSNFAPKEKSALQTNINRIDKSLKGKFVKEFLGDTWNVIWGPCLSTSGLKPGAIQRYVTDNALYVAKSERENTYFIGVSGTNGQSRVNWFDEDFEIEEMVDWPYSVGSGAQPKISKGAHNGLQKLLGMVDPKKGGLIKYLKQELQNSNATVAIGGHSLGGCLSPVLAAELAHQLSELEGVKIETYPTAGPTPGNKAFADYLVEKEVKYHSVHNENDIVPISWDFKGLPALISNYSKWEFVDSHIKLDDPLIEKWLEWAKEHVSENGYTRLPSSTTSQFTVDSWTNEGPLKVFKKGKDISSDAIKGLEKYVLNSRRVRSQMRRIYRQVGRANLMEFSRFLVQVGLQHVTAYSNAHSCDEETLPISGLSEDLRKELSGLFNQKDGLGKYWKREIAVKLFTELAKKVANYFKDEVGIDEIDQELETIIKDQMSPEELQLEEQFDAILEMENEQEQEEAIAAMDIDDLQDLPWNWNPFSF